MCTAPLLAVHVPDAVQHAGPGTAIGVRPEPLERRTEQLEHLGVAGLLAPGRAHPRQRRRRPLRRPPALLEQPQRVTEPGMRILELILFVTQLAQTGEQPRLALTVLTAAHRRHGRGMRTRPGVTRHAIGEAMGSILMGRHHITEEQAFDVLRRSSQENNVKLREVAHLVCAGGGLP